MAVMAWRCGVAFLMGVRVAKEWLESILPTSLPLPHTHLSPQKARDKLWGEIEALGTRRRPLVAASIGPYGAVLHDGYVQ